MVNGDLTVRLKPTVLSTFIWQPKSLADSLSYQLHIFFLVFVIKRTWGTSGLKWKKNMIEDSILQAMSEKLIIEIYRVMLSPNKTR